MFLRMIAAVVFVIGGFGAQSSANDHDRTPNIIFLYADDLGYAELGCYGQELIRTPNIDRIAREGIRFTQHYSGQAVCAPARCSLMTGKHQGHAYIRNNGNPKERLGKNNRGNPYYFPGQNPIPDRELTIAEILKSKGYATAAIGKWGLGFPGSSGSPNHQGFDLFYGFNCQRHAHNHYPRFLMRNDEIEKLPGNDRTLSGQSYSQDLFIAEAKSFIRSNKDKPFFLYMPFAIPHLSIQVPDESLKQYAGVIKEAEYQHRGYLKHPTPRAGYAAMVSHMDQGIGEIMELVKKLGLDKHTIIMFSSDNGPAKNRLGGSDSNYFKSAGNFRGYKGSLYEGGIRVPLVARWPGKIAAGQTSNHISANWDLLPTINELVGADQPDGIDGISFAPTLLGNAGKQDTHDYLYWEFSSYGGQQAIRRGNWKAVRQNLTRNPHAPVELYNLAEDISEKKDLAKQHPEIVAKLKDMMASAREPSELFKFPALDDPENAKPKTRIRKRQNNRSKKTDPSASPAKSESTRQVSTPRSNQPNIILIISDDAGYQDFSFQGSKHIETPNLDRLASSGIRFTQGYVSSSVCSPSRAGMITGRYQQRFGHEMNIPPRYSEENGLPLTEKTMADLLRKSGYRTIALGKWHLGYSRAFHPCSRGFDDYYGFLQGARSFWAMDKPTRLNRMLRNFEPVEENFDYVTDELSKQACNYINAQKSKPIFMYLSFNAVHTPMHALQSDLEQVSSDHNEKRRKLIAMTQALDRAVGNLMQTLKKNQLSENTLLVFVNDNGGAKTNASINTPLRGTKGTPYEGGIRIPFLVSWPAKLKPGSFEQPVSTLDLLPTFLAAAGEINTPSNLDGVNILPHLTGNVKSRPHPTMHWRRGDNWAIRHNDWKLLRHKDNEVELFDLSNDPSEKINLASQHPKIVHDLRGKHQNWTSQLAQPRWNYKKKNR